MYHYCELEPSLIIFKLDFNSELGRFYINFPGAGDVWFSLNGATNQNNSCVALKDIGEGNDSLLCVTKYNACCTSDFGSALGNWFFPNGTKIPDNQRDFYTTRGHMVIRLNHRSGEMDGIYRCEIPDSMTVIETIYIGVYTANTNTGK